MAHGAGIPNPKASVAVKGQREAIVIVPGSDELITQPDGIVDVPDWMAMGFLVHMNAKHGGKAPVGDLRFVIDTKQGVRQLVIIQCNKHAGNGTVRPAQIANAYDDLQECVSRCIQHTVQQPIACPLVLTSESPCVLDAT